MSTHALHNRIERVAVEVDSGRRLIKLQFILATRYGAALAETVNYENRARAPFMPPGTVFRPL